MSLNNQPKIQILNGLMTEVRQLFWILWSEGNLVFVSAFFCLHYDVNALLLEGAKHGISRFYISNFFCLWARPVLQTAFFSAICQFLLFLWTFFPISNWTFIFYSQIEFLFTFLIGFSFFNTPLFNYGYLV